LRRDPISVSAGGRQVWVRTRPRSQRRRWTAASDGDSLQQPPLPPVWRQQRRRRMPGQPFAPFQ